MKERWRFFAEAVLALSLGACTVDAPAATRTETDTDVAALREAARWPGADDTTILSLATTYFASRRDKEAYDLFLELHDAQPDRALFLAMAGMFQARMSGQIGLTRRVAWVEEAVEKLDRATAQDPTIPRFLRGMTLAALPSRFDEGARAVRDLEAVVGPGSFLEDSHRTSTLAGALRRSSWRGLSQAHATMGHEAEAEDAAARAGHPATGPNAPLIATPYSVTGRDGFRFGAEALYHPVHSVYVARGYDFANIAFVETAAGVVAIDAGTTVRTATAALEAFRREVTRAPLVAVILTHGHWDHVGGLAALRGDSPEIIAQVGIFDELERITGTGVGFGFFFGEEFDPASLDVRPDRLISSTETLTFGDTDFELIPVRGGETQDALLVHLPQRRLTFVGDAFMPYLGAPFVAEGSAQGLLETIELLDELETDTLIHGHVPLTDFFTRHAIAPLGIALEELYAHILSGVAEGRTVSEILHDNLLPSILKDEPASFMPYFLLRDRMIKRVHRTRTGYWQADGEGMEVHSTEAWAGAVDLLAEHDPQAFVRAVQSLVSRGDHALAKDLADLGLLAHPDDVALHALRVRALDGLREKYQLINPFKFIVYSELAGHETLPLSTP